LFDVNALKDNFGKAAPVYERHAHLQRVVREHGIALAGNYWAANTHILDLGCGTGAFSHEAQRLKTRWQVTSLDLSYGMCRHAAKQTTRIVNANAENIPFADACFEGVFSSLMLQWVNTPARVFREMARITQQGSACVISTLVQGTLHELRDAFAAIDNAPHVSDFLSAHDILAMADSAGFSLELARQNSYTEHHTDVIVLMRSLQAIGATNKASARKRGLSTPQQFAQVERVYAERFGSAKGLPATWQVLHLVLRRR